MLPARIARSIGVPATLAARVEAVHGHGIRGRPLLPEGEPRHGERANGNHAASDEPPPCEQARHRPRSREPRTPTQAFSAHARPPGPTPRRTPSTTPPEAPRTQLP